MNGGGGQPAAAAVPTETGERNGGGGSAKRRRLLDGTSAAAACDGGAATALLDSIPGMVFAYQINPDGTSAFTYISSYSTTLLGLAPDEIVGTATGDSEDGSSSPQVIPAEVVLGRIVPEDRPGFHQRLMECLQEGTVWEWTGRMTRKRRRRRSNNGIDAEDNGEDGKDEEVRMVKFTSSCPPIRQAVIGSTAGGDDVGTAASTEQQQQYITVFHGIVLDVTPPPPSPASASQAAMRGALAPASALATSSADSSAPVPSTASSAPTATTTSSSSDAPVLASAIATLRSVLDSAPHPVIALDSKGTVTEWNRTAEILTGYAKAEAVGKNFATEFVVGACRKDVLRMLEDVSHLAERQMAAAAAIGGANGTAGANGGGLVRKRPAMAPGVAGARASAGSGRGRSGSISEADPSCEATLQTKPGNPPVHLLLTASPKRVVPAVGATAAAASASGPTNGTVIIAQDMSKQHATLALHRSETEKGIMEWLSHEVRNPLSVAVEASRTLKEDPSDDPEENSNNLELICLSLGYIVELLTDMLDLNKCAEGKITINPTVCRLREDIVLPTKMMLDARRKSVDLIIDGGEEIWAYVDRLRLQQVLTNLIVNSMKYTSIGFIRVGIRRISREEIGGAHLECATGTDRAQLDDKAAADSAALPTMDSLFGGGVDSQMVAVTSPSGQNGYYGEEGGVLISVSDSGSGIDPSNYQNLFERWEKLGSKTNGTGIGLCLCRSLMEVMGGRIFLSKTYNSGIPGNPGCQFCIVLPPTALDGTAAAADYQSGGGGSSEDVSICTAALSKRLSRDKNKPESVLKTFSSYDKLASTEPPQTASLPVGADALDTSSMWKQNDGVEAGTPSQLLENGDAGRDTKKVSFAPQLDDAESQPPLHAQNPSKLAGFSYDNGADAQTPLPDNGAAFNGSTTASTSPIRVSNASAASTVTANTAPSAHHHHQTPTDDPFHNTCLSGKFRLLVVDDDETFRIMFVRRLKRMFPNGFVDESPSGEDSIEKAKKNVYDLVTMDHFMALDELNGADTIRALRSNNCDACIIGISGNTKTVHHLEAGADDFIRKPVPTDRRFIRRLVSKMAPPAVWKVLIADDCKLNLKFMHRKLIKVASPHYTTKQESDKRWQFTLKTNGEDCVDCLKEEWFDLCVLDQHMGPGLKGTDVASFIRKGAVNPNAIVVINTGVEKNLQEQGNWNDHTAPFNCQWTKPAPSIEKIRQDLCLELVAEKTSSGTNFGESLTKAALLKASVNDGDAELVREGEEDDTLSVISEGSIVDFDSNASGKEETRQLPEYQKVLQKLYDEIGDEVAFSDMCILFVTTVPAQLDTIDESLNEHDWNNLSLILHKLKGTLQVFHIDACVALIKPLYEQSLVLKTRGQKRKQGEDEPCDDVSNKELDQMRQSCSQLRVDIVSVIKVCQGVIDNGA